MKTLLSRSTLLGALLLLPGCASLAQDPQPYRNVAYSPEELDNLVAPVALYPDALLAQILVAATFPEQVAIASRYVRERGTRNIDDQGWDISVKAVAYYPPVLNMLANDEDWSIALGQAYASQSADLMDAVQRLREMAREQGNLVSTREHTVTDDRGRIIIVPANPQVIYVPTYDPAIVYVRPIFGFGFHTGYFSFGIGFPIGSWLAYDMDWWGHRVYYDGWYGDGWRYQARRYFPMHHVYVRPRYSVVNININIFSRRVNYINLDRRHRYVRRTVVFERHDPGSRYADRGGLRGDDRRGPYGSDRTARPVDRGDPNDRIGNRVATFDDYRPDRGRNGPDARVAEPAVGGSGFGTIDRKNGTSRQPRANNDGGGNIRGSSSELRGSKPDVPVFTSLPRSAERKATGTARPQSDQPRSARPEAPVFTSLPRASEGKSKGNGGSELRSAPRANAPVISAPQRSVERKSSGGNGGSQRSDFRSAPRNNAPVYSAPQRSVERKSSGGGSAQRSEFRSAPRNNAPVYSAPQRSVERKSSGGGSAQRSEFRSAPRSNAQVYSAPQRSVERKSSGGGGGGAQFSRPSASASRPAKSSSPSVARSSSGGGSASFRQSSGAKGGGGKGRK